MVCFWQKLLLVCIVFSGQAFHLFNIAPLLPYHGFRHKYIKIVFSPFFSSILKVLLQHAAGCCRLVLFYIVHIFDRIVIYQMFIAVAFY